MDVGRCYWNSRLGPERARLVAQWGPGDVVLDLCAGVGPIAIPAARRGAAQVFANDLNPTAAAYCLENAARAGVVRAYFDWGNRKGGFIEEGSALC